MHIKRRYATECVTHKHYTEGMKNEILTEKFKSFKSIRDLLTVFPAEKKCEKYLEQVRLGNKVVSPYDETAKVYKCSRNRYRCSKTKKNFNVRTRTMFENTKIELRTWFVAIYIVNSHKKGISSLQLAKDLNVTQQTAWYVLHRIRKCFATENNDISKYYNHSVVKHCAKEFVNGSAYTNNIERFWGILKRGIIGIYHFTSKKHLQNYLDEFVFHFNTREFSETDRFERLLTNMTVRTRYRDLVTAI